MTNSDHIHMIKVDIEIPQSPSKEPIIPHSNCSFRYCQILLLGFLERIMCLLLLLSLLAVLSWYIFTVIVYTENDPQFQIVSASVNTYAVHDQFEDFVKAEWEMVVSTTNSNERTPIVYERVSVMMFYYLNEFGPWDAIATPVREEPRNQTTFVARSEPQSKGTNLKYDILETILEFNVTIQVDLSFKCRTCLRERLLELDVFCPQVEVFHASNGPGIEKSQLCSVQGEHLISKLHFSWPQSSCGSECPIRGGRVVFASYKDSMGQIQKFAMRFMRSSDSKSFIDSLKEIVQKINKIGSPINTSEARVQSEIECPTLCGVHQRAAVELNALYPAVSDSQLHTLSSNGAHHVILTSNGFSCSHANLPSSCSPESQEGGTDQLKISPKTDMFSYLKKHMPSSSFHVMLSSMMEKFINDMGRNLALQTT